MTMKKLWILPLLGLAAVGCATTKTTSPEGDLAVVSPASTDISVAATDSTVTARVEEPVTVQVEPIALERPVTIPAPPQIPPILNSVEFVSPELVDRVVVTHTGYERTPGQAFKVQCTLRNMSGEPIRLQARTQYFSEDRQSQEGPGAWQLVFLPANGMDTYTAYSYGTNLEYYYVEVKEL